MTNELEHIPASSRGRFIFGCLTAAVSQRMTSSGFPDFVARSVLVTGALLWAALNLRFAGRMSMTDALGLEIFGYCMALTFAAGAFATASLGCRAAINSAPPLMIVLTLAATIIWLDSAPQTQPNLYLALLVEDLVVLLCALAVAGSLLGRLPGSRGKADGRAEIGHGLGVCQRAARPRAYWADPSGIQ